MTRIPTAPDALTMVFLLSYLMGTPRLLRVGGTMATSLTAVYCDKLQFYCDKSQFRTSGYGRIADITRHAVMSAIGTRPDRTGVDLQTARLGSQAPQHFSKAKELSGLLARTRDGRWAKLLNDFIGTKPAY